MLLPTQLAQPAPARGSASSHAELCQPPRTGCCESAVALTASRERRALVHVAMLSLVERRAEVILGACPCRYSGPFLKAVSEKQAPGYGDVVKR